MRQRVGRPVEAEARHRDQVHHCEQRKAVDHVQVSKSEGAKAGHHSARVMFLGGGERSGVGAHDHCRRGSTRIVGPSALPGAAGIGETLKCPIRGSGRRLRYRPGQGGWYDSNLIPGLEPDDARLEARWSPPTRRASPGEYRRSPAPQPQRRRARRDSARRPPPLRRALPQVHRRQGRPRQSETRCSDQPGVALVAPAPKGDDDQLPTAAWSHGAPQPPAPYPLNTRRR